MNAILAVIKREYLTRVKNRGFLIGTLIMPLFILAITTIPTLMALKKVEKPRTILVFDETQDLSRKFEAVFSDTNKTGETIYNFKEVYPESDWETQKADLFQQVQDDEASGVLYVPEGIYGSNAMSYYAKSVTDFTFLRRLEDGITQLVTEYRLSAEGLNPEKVKNLTKRLDMATFKVDEGGEAKEDKGFSFWISYILVFTLYMMVLLYGQQIQQSVIEEKTSRVVEVVVSSVKPFHLMLGKIIGVCSVGLTQFAIWLVALVLVTTYSGAFIPSAEASMIPDIPFSFYLFFMLFFVLGFFLYGSMYAAIGAMVNSEQEAQQLQFFVISFLILGIVMMMPIIKGPDTSLAVILSMIPLISPITMYIRVTVQMPPVWEMILSIGILFSTVVFMIWLSSRIYRIGILMYGKRPNLPEVMKWIRYK